MIFVWGHKVYVTASGDQTPLTQVIECPPCLNQHCQSSRGCRIFKVQKYCTVYFCIPLCPSGPPIEVVKCEACRSVWELDPYIATVQISLAARSARPIVAATDQTGLVAGHAGPVTILKDVPFAYCYVPDRDYALDAMPDQEVPAAAIMAPASLT